MPRLLFLVKNVTITSIGIFIGAYFYISAGEQVFGKNIFQKNYISPLPLVQISPTSTSVILGTQTYMSDFKLPTPTPTFIFIPSPTPSPFKQLKKNSYVISLVGDSMTETCQEGCPALAEALVKLFPGVSFAIKNNSVGATDLISGYSRLTNSYQNHGERPPVLSQDPDLVVLESFAYNHWSNMQTDLDKYWLTLAHIVDTIHTQKKKLLFLATVAPNSSVYAKNAPGISWSEQERWNQAAQVKLYLETFISFAKSQKIPYVDVYHESLDAKTEGDLMYISKDSYIHPSPAGFRLMADLLAQGIGDVLE